MAIYRNVHISFWQDPFVLKLTPEEKYFYLYLMTNSKTTQCGIYEIPKSIMNFETGYNQETIDKLLKKFIKHKKIIYDDSTNEMMLVNWLKYNYSKSPKVVACIKKEIKNVKSQTLLDELHRVSIEYGYNMDTCPNREREEEEQEQEEEKHTLTVWIGKNCKRVATLSNQLTTDQCDSLLDKYGEQKVRDKLYAMENRKDLTKKYDSVYLTLNNWLKKDNPEESKREPSATMKDILNES